MNTSRAMVLCSWFFKELKIHKFEDVIDLQNLSPQKWKFRLLNYMTCMHTSTAHTETSKYSHKVPYNSKFL